LYKIVLLLSTKSLETKHSSNDKNYLVSEVQLNVL